MAGATRISTERDKLTEENPKYDVIIWNEYVTVTETLAFPLASVL